MTIRAHFDGKVLVLDEPADLHVGESLELEVKKIRPHENVRANTWAEERGYIEALIAQGPVPGGRTWKREDLYD